PADIQDCFELFPCQLVALLVKVTNHLEHVRTRQRIAVVTRRRGWCLVPISTRPDLAMWIDCDMLSDVRPSVSLGMILPHTRDGGLTFPLGMVGPPAVVYVHARDLPSPGEVINFFLPLCSGPLLPTTHVSKSF